MAITRRKMPYVLLLLPFGDERRHVLDVAELSIDYGCCNKSKRL